MTWSDIDFQEITEIEIIISVLLFLAGLILGNWLAIGRDKRQEFNEIADHIHLLLKQERGEIEVSSFLNDKPRGPNDDDLEILKRRISRYKKKGLEKAIKRYNNANSIKNWKRDGYGGVTINDPRNLIEAIKNLQKYVKRK